LKLYTQIFFIALCRKIFFTGLLLVYSSSSLYSQEFIKNIEKAIKLGKAKDIALYFDKYIDLSFSEKTNTYSKKQAEVIVQKFFTKVEPKDFTKINKGTSYANNTIYYIGTLETSNGQYQVYMFFVIRNATYYLKEIRFEKE
jgi:hypothetical protein